MNPTTWTDWLRALAAEMAEGAVDAFIIVSGGATVAGTAPTALPANTTFGALCSSIALGAAWYGAAWIKAHPFPFSVRSSASVPSVSNP